MCGLQHSTAFSVQWLQSDPCTSLTYTCCTCAVQLGNLLQLAPITLGGVTPALGVPPLNLGSLLGPQFVGARTYCSAVCRLSGPAASLGADAL